MNGGFYVIRNSPSVRAFLANVVAKGKMFPKLHDQDIYWTSSQLVYI